jgi:formate dehydrogenase
VASVGDDQRVEVLRPDHDHPVTRGFACAKGLLAAEVHRDPARVRIPQRRRERGFVDVGWDEAITDIAARLRAVIAEHGPGGVGIYLGNPNAFNVLAGVGAMIFAGTIGSDRMFSASTQDCANKYAVAELLYGIATANPIPDLEGTQLLLVIGSNPRVSMSSFLSVPQPVQALRSIRDRGGRVVFVNPLAIEANIGETVQLRPDTDAYLLAAMLHEIHRTRGFTLGALGGRVKGVDAVAAFVEQYAPDRVADVVGVPADRIRRLARDFAEAEGASVHVSTGLNMGRQGALAYWLAQMLVLLTGNLDRPGGSYFAARGFAGAPPPRGSGLDSYVHSKWGAYRPAVGMMPGALLADMIEDDDEPLRALFVLAGNPVLSIGGSARLASALGSLDLLVTLDLYRNATGELAHYVLPATDQFERADLNTFVQGIQARPYVQHTEPIATPDGEQRAEWRVLGDVLVSMGHDLPFDLSGPDALAAMMDGALEPHGLSIDGLRRAGGVVVLDEAGPEGSVDRLGISLPIACVPPALEPTLARGHELFGALVRERPAQLKLITRRTPHTLNSAFQNVAALKDRGAGSNPLWMAPDDAERLGLEAGALATMRTEHGEVTAEVRIDERLRTGVVAMTHGFGNQRSSGMPVAQSHPGVNVNLLGPVGPGSFDPVSGMAQLTGIPVEVEPADRDRRGRAGVR